MIYGLSESDRNYLRELIAEDQRKRETSQLGSVDRISMDQTQSAEVYIAQTPGSETTGTADDGGIPGRVGDVPGSAMCYLYTLHRSSIGTPSFKKLGEFQERVFNLSTSKIFAARWVLVIRDKHGYWFASSSSSITGEGTHKAIINLECSNEYIKADEVEYLTKIDDGVLTVTPTILRDNFIAIPTICKEFVTGLSFTLSNVGVTCVAGVITVTQPTLTITLVTDRTKGIDCGDCTAGTGTGTGTGIGP